MPAHRAVLARVLALALTKVGFVSLGMMQGEKNRGRQEKSCGEQLKRLDGDAPTPSPLVPDLVEP